MKRLRGAAWIRNKSTFSEPRHGTMVISEIAIHITIALAPRVYLMVPRTVIFIAVSPLVTPKVQIFAWAQGADDPGIEVRPCPTIDFHIRINYMAPLGRACKGSNWQA